MIPVEVKSARDDVEDHLAQRPVLSVGICPHPGQRLGQGDTKLDHNHALRLEQLGPAVERRGRTEHDDRDVGDVEDQFRGGIETTHSRDDLHGMPWEPERRTQLHQLRVPDGEDHSAAADRGGAGEDRLRGDSRQSFVNQVRVGVAAAERAGIPSAGVSIRRTRTRPT